MVTVLAEAAVAVTDFLQQAVTRPARTKARSESPVLGHLMLATAMSLVGHNAVQAASAPEQGRIAYKYLNYKDWQPGQDRIGVKAHAFEVVAPLGEEWSVSASHTIDSISGASPSYYTTAFANMKDTRRATSAAVSHYMPNSSVTIGVSVSNESDYESRSLSFSGTLESEDKNTTFAYGAGLTRDKITAFGLNEDKQVAEFMLGVTQVLTPKDIVQINATFSNGDGYFSDPYKLFDQRPDTRNHYTLLGRWNHFIEPLDATSRLSYRYYGDTWGIRSNTLTGELVKPLRGGWTLTPSVRLYSQSAADFYLDPTSLPAPTIPPGLNASTILSEDQRLSAFGGLTLGLKVEKKLDPNWTVDLKYERYEQRSDWYSFGAGSPGLDRFRADFVQLGIARTF